MMGQYVLLGRLTARLMRRWWRGPGLAWLGAIVLSYGAFAYALHYLSINWLAQPTPYPWWAYLLPSPFLLVAAGWLHASITSLRETEDMTEQVAAPQAAQFKRTSIVLAYTHGLWLALASLASYIAYSHAVNWILGSLPSIQFQTPPGWNAWNSIFGPPTAPDGVRGVLAAAHLGVWLTAMASYRWLRGMAPFVILALYTGNVLTLFLEENYFPQSLAAWVPAIPFHAVLGLALCILVLLFARMASSGASRASLLAVIAGTLFAGPIWLYCWDELDNAFVVQAAAWTIRGIPDYLLGNCYPWFGEHLTTSWPVRYTEFGAIGTALALGGITIAATLAIAAHLAGPRSTDPS